MDIPTTPHAGDGSRLIWAEPEPPIGRHVAEQALLSPVVDRPDRRISPALRLRSFLARPRFRGSLLRLAFGVMAEEATVLRRNLAEALETAPRLQAVHVGVQGLARAASVAAFVHYAPNPGVSGMVLRRIEALRAQGFAVVFITAAPGLPPLMLDRLRALCALVVQRRNHGLDFGAWHDVAALLRRAAPTMQELLLVNDSVCGPFRAEAPILATMRAAGHGLFGLTENLAPRPHLQSYWLLGRGRPVVADLLRFLDRFPVTASKRRTIRRGEVFLSTWMRRRGHAVAALCGYEAVEAAALRRSPARRRLRALYPFLFADIPVNAPGEVPMMRRAMQARPVNATHAFWRELVEDFGFPFLKTELVTRNPLGLCDAVEWRRLLPAEDGQALDILVSTHLAMMRMAPPRA